MIQSWSRTYRLAERLALYTIRDYIRHPHKEGLAAKGLNLICLTSHNYSKTCLAQAWKKSVGTVGSYEQRPPPICYGLATCGGETFS